MRTPSAQWRRPTRFDWWLRWLTICDRLSPQSFPSEALRNGQSGSLTELQQRQLGLIYAAALGLAGVTNDLMTIAQEQTSGQFDEAVAFSLHDTFEAVREMIAPTAETKRIQLRFGMHCSDHRHGHPGPLGRVLLNLTTNAMRFTPEGGSVDVLANPVARDTVEVSVRDTGQGIPLRRMARLYERSRNPRVGRVSSLPRAGSAFQLCDACSKAWTPN